MPLLDHFRPPLYPRRAWESFHSRLANSIADELQRILPSRFFAEVQIHLGANVEADIAEFECRDDTENHQTNGVAVQQWAPPAATMVLPIVYPDDIEVQVRDEREDARLAAVIELVSPRNKDRSESRRAFAAKCVAYLQRGIGLIILDIVTSRSANLHNELMEMLAAEASFRMSDDSSLYCVSYRPTHRSEANEVDLWPKTLTLGDVLPVLPLALRGSHAIPLDLEISYANACQRSNF